MDKDIIFISHSSSSQKDNYFSKWLAAKLKGLGYKVWIDLDHLKAGQSFWPTIQNIIKNQSIRFLACVTSDYIKKAGTSKTGVLKELSCADSIDIKEFIIPLKLDKSNWNDLPIHLIEINGIDFSNNWATGLNTLIKEFGDANIPNNSKGDDVLKFWYKAQQISSETISKEEKYLTNYLNIKAPSKIYIHETNNPSHINNFNNFISYKDKNLFISLTNSQDFKNIANISNTHIYDFNYFIKSDNIYITDETSIKNTRQKVIALLNKAFNSYLLDKCSFTYNYSNNLTAYFLIPEKKRVSLKSFGKTSKSINGIEKGHKWYFGVTFHAATFPFLHYKLKYHVVFKDSEDNFLSKEKQHSLRRSICSTWYNNDWRDRLLAWLTTLSNCNDKLNVHLGNDDHLIVLSKPYSLYSKIGYIEPN